MPSYCRKNHLFHIVFSFSTQQCSANYFSEGPGNAHHRPWGSHTVCVVRCSLLFFHDSLKTCKPSLAQGVGRTWVYGTQCTSSDLHVPPRPLFLRCTFSCAPSLFKKHNTQWSLPFLENMFHPPRMGLQDPNPPSECPSSLFPFKSL